MLKVTSKKNFKRNKNQSFKLFFFHCGYLTLACSQFNLI